MSPAYLLEPKPASEPPWTGKIPEENFSAKRGGWSCREKCPPLGKPLSPRTGTTSSRDNSSTHPAWVLKNQDFGKSVRREFGPRRVTQLLLAEPLAMAPEKCRNRITPITMAGFPPPCTPGISQAPKIAPGLHRHLTKPPPGRPVPFLETWNTKTFTIVRGTRRKVVSPVPGVVLRRGIHPLAK